jgi:tetratricopeptide (TPR) repeat protein
VARERHLSENAVAELLAGTASLRDAPLVLAHLDACDSCRLLVGELAQQRSHRSSLVSAAVPEADVQVTPGETIGRYIVLHAVGAGGMGVVYAAYDPELDRRVALKVVRGHAHATTGPRMAREARLLARVSDPHVVSVHDVGYVGTHVFLVMDFVDGVTLRGWLAGARDPRSVLELCLAAGKGLAAAHREGVVHGDFKPENVMVSRDGRAYVTDFGLALGPTDLGGRGTLGGTLAYMAPEQLRGGGATPESDQFAFALTVYEALVGARPFAGTTREERLRAMQAGGPRRPRSSKLVTRVYPALARALAFEPSARHGSMAELLAALSPTPRGLRVTVVGAALVTAALAGFSFVRTGSAAAPCEGVERGLASVWNGDELAKVKSAFLAVPGAPFAETMLGTVTAGLDGYARAWASAATRACVATRIRGERSEATLDRSMACLGERRLRLSALTRALEHADRKTVERAAAAVGSLPDVETCVDLRPATSIRAVPFDPALRATSEHLATSLATYEVEDALGRYPALVEPARSLLAEARASGDGQLAAEAGLVLGDALMNTGDAAGAERVLLEAVWAAESSGDDRATAEAFVRLVRVKARAHPASDAVTSYEHHADAWIERLGGVPELRAELLRLEADEANQLRRPGEALEKAEAAVKAQRESEGAMSLGLGTALGVYAGALLNVGRLDEADAAANEGLAILRESLGPEHPLAVTALHRLAETLVDSGRYEEARAKAAEALSLSEASFGPETLQVAGGELTLAVALSRVGRLDEARLHLERELAICRKLVGDHVWTLDAIVRVAGVDIRARRLADADRELAEAEAMMARLPEVASDVRLDVANTRVELELLSHRPEQALAALARSAPLVTTVTDKRVLAEHALREAQATGSRDPRRASAAALHAKALCAEADLRDLAAEVETWLAAHPTPA